MMPLGGCSALFANLGQQTPSPILSKVIGSRPLATIGSDVMVEVHVKDVMGQPIAGTRVYLASNRANDTIPERTQLSSVDGKATFRVSSLVVGESKIEAYVSNSDLLVETRADVRWTDPPALAITSFDPYVRQAAERLVADVAGTVERAERVEFFEGDCSAAAPLKSLDVSSTSGATELDVDIGAFDANAVVSLPLVAQAVSYDGVRSPCTQVGRALRVPQASNALAILGPPAATAAPNGVRVGIACRSDNYVTVTGDITGSPRRYRCEQGNVVARLTFSGSDGVKNVTVSQPDADGVVRTDTRAFAKTTGAAVGTWASMGFGSCSNPSFLQHPRDRKNIIIGNMTTSIDFRTSVDGGATTTIRTASIPFDTAAYSGLWASPYQTNLFYVTAREKVTNVWKIYKSSDGGVSWSATGAPPAGITGRAAYDDSPGRIMGDAFGRLYIAIDRGYAVSSDEGATWNQRTYSELNAGAYNVPHITVSADGQRIWLATGESNNSWGSYTGLEPQGIFQSFDGGLNMAFVDALAALKGPFTGTGFGIESGLQVSPYNPLHMIASAGQNDQLVYRTTDGGSTWSSIGDALAVTGNKGFSRLNDLAMAWEPGDADTFWIRSLLRDVNGGVTAVTYDGGATFSTYPGTSSFYSWYHVRTVDVQGREVLIKSDGCSNVMRQLIDRF
jgi:hypothetical protein